MQIKQTINTTKEPLLSPAGNSNDEDADSLFEAESRGKISNRSDRAVSLTPFPSPRWGEGKVNIIVSMTALFHDCLATHLLTLKESAW
jgi:hypothetical protein